MSKKCKKPDCSNPVFSKGFCSFHGYMGLEAPQSVSKKRSRESNTYTKVKENKRLQLIRDDNWRCIFCNQELPEQVEFRPDWHHLKGRDGSLFMDEKYLWPAHTECHINIYHQSSVSTLVSMYWWEQFLHRLKEIDVELYNKEIRRIERSK